MLETEIDSFRPRFQEAGLTLDLIRHGNGPWRVQADEQRLSQSFRNLLRNSLRYTDSGGRVRVTLQGSAKGPALDFDDIAPGVPADALPKLFERLCRVERSRSRSTGGAGLGLAIARNIVEAHGGTIGAEPSPLGGLPANPCRTARHNRRGARPMNQFIMIVEDERRLAKLLSDYLKAAGYKTQLLGDGSKVAQWVRENAPSLMLLDLMLPGTDGLDVCRQVRALSDLPIIMTAARGEEVDRLIGLELGADDHVRKPYSPREVVARLKAVLRRGKPAPGPLSLDEGSLRVRADGRETELTAGRVRSRRLNL